MGAAHAGHTCLCSAADCDLGRIRVGTASGACAEQCRPRGREGSWPLRTVLPASLVRSRALPRLRGLREGMP